MSNIAIKGATTGTGVFTLESPATNTDRTLVLPDEAGTIITTAGVPFSALPAGSVLQVKNYQFGSLLSLGNVQIPYDDTIPQITEGGEVMTLTITPQSASSKLMIEVLVNACPSLSGEKMVVSLFQDTTVDAIACVSEELFDSSYMVAIPLRHFMSSPGTSAVTFSVRAGRTDSSANSFTINGYLGARKFGGALATSITITEIAD